MNSAEGELSIRQDETMPQLMNTISSQRHQHQSPSTREEPAGLSLGESNIAHSSAILASITKVDRRARDKQHTQQQEHDVATLKTPRAPVLQNSNFSDDSTVEERIKSDVEIRKSDDEASPQYSNVSSEDSEVEYIKTTPSKGRNELRVSQSLIMNKSQIERALKTFTASKSLFALNNRELSSERPSQVSRITDYAQTTDFNQNKQGLKMKKNSFKSEDSSFSKFLNRARIIHQQRALIS